MLAAAAAAAVVSGADNLLYGAPVPSRSVNEQLGVAVVGTRGAGTVILVSSPGGVTHGCCTSVMLIARSVPWHRSGGETAEGATSGVG